MTRIRGACLAAVLAVAMAGGATGRALAADTVTTYSADGQWRATLHAWTTNLVAYKSIGSTLSVQHREWVCTGPFCWGGHSWQWIDRSVPSLALRNGYDPWPGDKTCPPQQCPPPAPPRSCGAQSRSSLDCFDWAIFTGAAQLNIKTVHAWGTAFLPGGGALSLGPVDNSFWF